MSPFGFASAGKIRFGRGTASEAVPALVAMGGPVLLVHGRSAKRAAWLKQGLEAEGLTVISVFCGGEPDLPMLKEGLAAAQGARSVVGLGGGAVIDLAKAIAALLPSSTDPLDHFEVVGKGLPLNADPLPFVAIPTTAGTGAEVTKNAVIGIPEHRRKVSLRDDRMLANFAIIDPALTDGCPRDVTLASGLDAITQVIEPFLSRLANPMSDALCREAIPRGLQAIRRLLEGEDSGARDEMALVSLFGGLALANAGLGAVHGLAGVVGGMTGAAHGAICGVLLPPVISANAAAMARGQGDTSRFFELDSWFAEAGFDGADGLAAWADEQGLATLGELGLQASDVPAAAAAARTSSSMKGNPVPLDEETLVAILAAASLAPPNRNAIA
ncbi:hypothetical protein SAMN05421688_1369 [Poseidonocella pacifica]|uniref:Uncharacterized protein n=1 Tax=Poseidonocella pacifica TaxID=871651 RepID=A0A1I0WFY3_9RHOB|nr:iron-containing alcohol dehydrogenase [Poseidonocella pacifica]SFA87307.1 hypothetical protein SAMN05421688_1369 [Poseidonocella pacifica]